MNKRSADGASGPQLSARELRHKLLSLTSAVGSCALLALRAASLDASIEHPVHLALSIGVPFSVAFLTLLVMVDYLVRSRGSGRTIMSRVSTRSRRVSAAAYCFTLALALLDTAAGRLPYLLIPGMTVYALMVWDRPGFLVISTTAAVALVMRFTASLGRPLGIDDLSVAATAIILSSYAAGVVKKNVLPSEERLRELKAQNDELWNLSFRDTLTGLFNRRYIQQIAEHLFARAVRYRESLHVLMIDIDHFKHVNDKLGHAVGDEVLAGVARAIESTVRTSDTVARYGGEEFIVYMVRSDPETTQFVANRIRDGVAAMSFPDVPWTVTISIGVAGLQEGDTLEALVERADRFLYVSKHHGRNRVSGF